MKFSTWFKKIYIGSPLGRVIVWVTGIALICVFVSLISTNVKQKPVINSINPPVGSPGDIMIITGSHFGENQGSSYVELGGSRVTSSGYLTWSDNMIKIVLPPNAQDGLLFVGTRAGKSEPEFFANQSEIPVAVRPNVQTTSPVLEEISPDSAEIGQIITLKGSNFGNVRGNSLVLFKANYTGQTGMVESTQTEYIPASERDFDYEYWTDTEIRVRVPDGASNGVCFVQTSKGNSEAKKFSVPFSYGKKVYSDEKTYVLQVSADIENQLSTDDALITLYLPKPQISSAQRLSNPTESSPEPVSIDNQFAVIHQTNLNQIPDNKMRFSQDYVVSSCAVTNHYKTDVYKPFADTKRLLYSAYTRADPLVPSDNSSVKKLARSIVTNPNSEKGDIYHTPHVQARLIYDYMLYNFKLERKIRTGNAKPVDMIQRGSGDAYDFAIMFTALCRAVGLPAVPIAGVLVEEGSTCKPHWWAEIYFENYGWFPVDIALAKGLPFTPFKPVENKYSFYYGSLDSQHIAFSRGYNEFKSNSQNSKIVVIPRSYSFQSIWEDASEGATSYSSLWNDIIVLGIY